MKVELLENVDLTMLQRLVQLETEAFGHGGLNEWHLVPFIRHGRVFVASEQQEAVGLIQYMRDWDNPRKAYLMGVSIAKEKRGQGLGTMLIRISLQVLKKEDIEEVELTVDPENCGAIRVYEGKLGFVAKGTRIDEYGAGEDRLVMILSLCNLT
ncbi:Mycothiol acetyltransferase [Sporomusa ovata DSM 2662]|uniref:Acetyltransferase (GNAT) family protein n=1 Tax=Sporomusa ovata TaxID=2378 RepID=A0A0U1KU51_9FIRM|nr:GNAT family N-acetyltransferase [Sporomusa ovata]EQB26871.1 acetyltransferase [Sporomusa ovata DSM 2662]CQR70971.1 acetyltransferase (GNAT) family protein [Sporomusa ovata]